MAIKDVLTSLVNYSTMQPSNQGSTLTADQSTIDKYMNLKLDSRHIDQILYLVSSLSTHSCCPYIFYLSVYYQATVDTPSPHSVGYRYMYNIGDCEWLYI